MSRILLADDSPHAQRMGERILREEGYEVVSVTDGQTAFLRLEEVDPDVLVADAFLPSKSGLDLCRFVKGDARFRHVRVVLTAGVLEQFDEAEARQAGADAVVRKPFEASAMIEAVRRLVEQAQAARTSPAPELPAAPLERPRKLEQAKPLRRAVPPQPAPSPPRPPTPAIEAERVRAAVTVALDKAMPALIDEITQRVLVALQD